jgi:hypothetical protein
VELRPSDGQLFPNPFTEELTPGSYRRVAQIEMATAAPRIPAVEVRRLANVWLFQAAPYWQSLPIVI